MDRVMNVKTFIHFQTFLHNSKEDMRESAAQLYATLATSTQSQQELVSDVQQLTKDLTSKVDILIYLLSI